MSTQLQLEFDQEKLTFMRSILMTVDLKAIIKELAELYVEFIKIGKYEAPKDEKNG